MAAFDECRVSEIPDYVSMLRGDIVCLGWRRLDAGVHVKKLLLGFTSPGDKHDAARSRVQFSSSPYYL